MKKSRDLGRPEWPPPSITFAQARLEPSCDFDWKECRQHTPNLPKISVGLSFLRGGAEVCQGGLPTTPITCAKSDTSLRLAAATT